LGLSGNAAQCTRIAKATGSLFKVLQVEDSIADHEADLAARAGIPAQITYGYIRRAAVGGDQTPPLMTIGQALARNRNGCVLVSTRQARHLRELSDFAP
jgi:hypothetical protein